MAGPFYSEGKYHVQVIDVALGESKTKPDGSGGNPQIVLRIRVINGLQVDSAGDEFYVNLLGQYDRTIYLTVTDKSQEMVLKKLRWAGWEGDRFETLTKDLLGRGIRAVCRIEQSQSEKYQGKDTEKWDLELPPLETKPLENNPSVAKKLNALFGKSLKATAVKTPANEASASATFGGTAHKEPEPVVAGGPPPDDEIHF